MFVIINQRRRRVVPAAIFKWLATATITWLAVAGMSAPAVPKSPGGWHCYRDVCHRVKTVDETQKTVGQTSLIETSYYDDPSVDRFNRGTFTSSGEVFSGDHPARASSANLPDGTELLVRNPENGRTSHVRVNDFGPFWGARLLDVTRRVAEDLGFQAKGVTKLEVTVIAPPPLGEVGYRRNRVWAQVGGYLGVLDQGAAAKLTERLIAKGGETTQVAKLPENFVAKGDQRTSKVGTVMASAQPALIAPDIRGDAAFTGRLPIEAPFVPIAEPSIAAPAPVALISQPIVEASRRRDASARKVKRIDPEQRSRAVAPSERPAETIGAIVVAAFTGILPAQAPDVAEPEVIERPVVPQLPVNAAFEVADADLSRDTAAQSRASEPGEPRQVTSARMPDLTARSSSGLLPLAVQFWLLVAAAIGGVVGLLAYAAQLYAPAIHNVPEALLAGEVRPEFAAGVVASETEVTMAQPNDRPVNMAAAYAVSPVVFASGAPAVSTAPAQATGITVSTIGADLTIFGTVTSRSPIVLAGVVVGRIVAPNVEILTGGRVEGEIEADVVDAKGRIEGTVTAGLLSLRASAALIGRAITQSIEIDASAHLDAHVTRPMR